MSRPNNNKLSPAEKLARIAALLEGELKNITHRVGVVGDAKIEVNDSDAAANNNKRGPPRLLKPLAGGFSGASSGASSPNAASQSLAFLPQHSSGGNHATYGSFRLEGSAAAASPSKMTGGRHNNIDFFESDGNNFASAGDFGVSQNFSGTFQQQQQQSQQQQAKDESGLVSNVLTMSRQHARCEPVTAAGARIERVFSLIPLDPPEFDENLLKM